MDDQDEGIVAYHGSPHDFDQFDLSKIGTGEGAQAYGHGLYFAENEGVARGYRDSLSGTKQSVYSQGAPLDFNSWAAAAARNLDADAKIYGFDAAKKSQLDDLTFRLNRELKLGSSGRPDEIQQAIALVQSATPDTLRVVPESSGHMYEVRINADPNKHFLDWDAPLSEQPEAIRRLAGWTSEWDEAHRAWRRQDADSLFAELEGTGSYKPVSPPRPPAGALRASMRGEELYDHLHNKMGAADWPVDADAATRAEFRRAAAERVSQHLMDNGIRGIRYLDAGSRSSTDAPTRNYVVFDDKHVSVRRKYEQGGAVQAMATGGEVDPMSDIPQIDNAVSVFPKPQRMFPEDAPVPGGMYLNAATKEDMTGHKAAMASIGVQPGGKPYFRASPDSVDETGTPGRGSAMAKTNLFKQKAGWKWAQAPEGHEATDTIVSVQHRGQHHYTLNAHFPKGVDLARYEKSSTEPRLRPTTQGNVTLGPQVGSILVRGKEHPVYEHVIVKSTGGEVSGKKTAGGSAVATMRRMSDPAVNEAIRVINRSGSSPRDAVTLSKRLLGRQ